MTKKKVTSKKVFLLLEYLVFLVIPFTVFLFISIRNKKRIEQKSETQSYTINQNIEINRLVNQGVSYINQRKYKESIEINLKVLSISPNNSTAYNNIGFAYGNLRQWDKGIEYCSKALSIDPGFQLAKNNINWMKNEKKN